MVSEEELWRAVKSSLSLHSLAALTLDTDKLCKEKATQLSPVCTLAATNKTKHMCASHFIGARHAARLTGVSELLLWPNCWAAVTRASFSDLTGHEEHQEKNMRHEIALLVHNCQRLYIAS